MTLTMLAMVLGTMTMVLISIQVAVRPCDGRGRRHLASF
jgi:hypothetical protein